jgi:hypothetical protein
VRIDIHRPELKAIIKERLQSGAYENAEDVIWQALRSSGQSALSAGASEAGNLVELFEPVRGLLTNEETDTLFCRNPSAGRPVDLGPPRDPTEARERLDKAMEPFVRSIQKYGAVPDIGSTWWQQLQKHLGDETES